MAKRSARVWVKLWSTAGTGYSYSFSRLKTGAKMEMVKYDPMVRRHCLFLESKPSTTPNGAMN